MKVRLAETDAEIAACFPVMRQLRPHLTPESFRSRVRAQQREGYRLAWLEVGGRPVAVAGYRLLESLADGPHLWVDDLVTDEAARSRGHGAQLLGWLVGRARAAGCESLQLASARRRADAHRFYDREGLARTAWVFERPLSDEP